MVSLFDAISLDIYAKVVQEKDKLGEEVERTIQKGCGRSDYLGAT